MTKIAPPTSNANPAFHALFGRLKALAKRLSDDGVNQHDRAHVLINACIGEGIDTGPQIVGLLAKLGFNKQHAGMMLKAGLQPEPERLNWGRRDDGTYYLASTRNQDE